MDADAVYSSLGIFFLIVMSAFFSGSETALISSGRVKLNHLAAKGVRGATRALKLRQDPADLLGTILVGNNLVNVMAAALATTLLGPVYATVVVTLLLLIFAEVTPKTLAATQPEPFACRVSLVVQAFGCLFKPIVWVTSGMTDLLLWPFLGNRHKQLPRFSRQELLTAIRLGAHDGELEPAETRITQEVLALKDKRVSELMIPLSEVDMISETASLDDVIREVSRSGATRYPVFRRDSQNLIGLLLVKDLLIHREGTAENWLQYIRPLMRCPASLEADELLRDMQLGRSHMAAVEDERGRILGVVTMEDVLEEIVGEIQDEFDEDEGELIQERSPGRYVVRGDVEVDDLCKVINADLGAVDQHATLRQYFDKHAQASKLGKRRLRTGSIRIRQLAPSRFEVWVTAQVQEASAEADKT